MKTLILLILALKQVTPDKICAGVASGEANHKIDTISGKGIGVTSVIPLTQTPENSTSGNLKQGHVREMLCPSCTGCTNFDVVMMTPTCKGDIPTAVASIHQEQTPRLSKCLPILSDLTNLRGLPKLLRKFKSLRVSSADAYPLPNLADQPIVSNPSGHCKLANGTSSMFGTLHWITGATKGAITGETITINHNCGDDEIMVLVWGAWADLSANFNTVYGVSTPQTYTSNFPSGRTSITPPLGNFPTLTETEAEASITGRVYANYEVLRPGEKGTIQYQRGFMAPGKFWCGKEMIPEIKAPVKTEKVVDCVHSVYGGFNKTKPFYTGIRAPTVGDCPVWVKKELNLVNGTKARTSLNPQTRGLFGAIAGFLEGGWEGMKAGWYGYSSTGDKGTKVAADLVSTQKAVTSISERINKMTTLTAKAFSQVNSAIEGVHQEVLDLNKKVEDYRAEDLANQIELQVLLENENILNAEEEHVHALKTKLIKLLGPSAEDMGDGCFQIKHQCNETCLDNIVSGNYSAATFDLPTFEAPILTGTVVSNIDTNTILLYYAVAASSATLAIAIAIGLVFGIKSGNVGCTVCL